MKAALRVVNSTDRLANWSLSSAWRGGRGDLYGTFAMSVR